MSVLSEGDMIVGEASQEHLYGIEHLWQHERKDVRRQRIKNRNTISNDIGVGKV